MSEDRDNADTREGINQAARDFRDNAHRAGNPNYTYSEAQARVQDARRKGDRKRENQNR